MNRETPIKRQAAPTVLLLACGDLGLSVAERLLAKGWLVTGVRREPPAYFPQGMQWIAADLTDARVAQTLPAFDFVLYTPSPSDRTLTAYRALYETALRPLVACASGWSTLRLWIEVSSTSVYGQDGGERVTEDTAPAPGSATGEVILAADQWVERTLGGRCCVVRFSGIYGENRHYLLRRVLQGAAFRVGHITNRIHRDDCVGLLTHLFERAQGGQAVARLYLGTDTHPVDEWTIGAWLASRLGVPTPPRVETHVPSGKRCCSVRASEYGYTWRYPTYEAGYRVELARWRANAAR